MPEKSDFALSVVASGDATYTDGSNSTFHAESYELESTGIQGSMIVDYTAHLNDMFGTIKATLDEDGLSTGIDD